MGEVKKFNLKEMVDYQDGSIVSRTIIDKKTGTATLFAFDKGESLSEHTTPYDAMVHLIDGAGEFVIGGVSYELNEGEMIIMPADIPHAVKAKEKFKMLLLMIRS
ncbi:MAG: cupin domain-containing protein [Candidatus Poribacteria bacterium]